MAAVIKLRLTMLTSINNNNSKCNTCNIITALMHITMGSIIISLIMDMGVQQDS